MGAIHPLLIIGIGLLLVVFSRNARIVAGLLLIVFCIAASARALTREHTCGSEKCFLQPSWAGLCTPIAGALLNETDGIYLQAVGTDLEARAKCYDIRVWN